MNESDRAQAATTGTRNHPEQDLTAAEARDIAALRREVQRRGLPAGPPPSFQITLLEAEGGLEQALARIEAVRTQVRDAPALRLSDPETKGPAPAYDAQQASAPGPSAAPPPANESAAPATANR